MPRVTASGDGSSVEMFPDERLQKLGKFVLQAELVGGRLGNAAEVVVAAFLLQSSLPGDSNSHGATGRERAKK